MPKTKAYSLWPILTAIPEKENQTRSGFEKTKGDLTSLPYLSNLARLFGIEHLGTFLLLSLYIYIFIIYFINI